MADAETYKILASLLGGGAVGALITAGVTTYRSRPQPIAWRAELSPLFTPGSLGSNLKITVAMSDGGPETKCANLHLADLQLVNRGNKDFAKFAFGITLGEA